jgi:hypothetical protein
MADKKKKRQKPPRSTAVTVLQPLQCMRLLGWIAVEKSSSTPSSFWTDHLSCLDMITSVEKLTVLRRLAGNSAAKAGGAEIESSILTKRFPIELFLG